MRFDLLLASLFALQSAACACATYPLNLAAEPDAEGRIRAAIRWVDEDLPSDALLTEEGFDALVLKSSVTQEHPIPIPGDREHDYDARQTELWSALTAGEIRSVYYPSRFHDLDVWHQVTAGTLDVPFDALPRRFDVALSWGPSLAGYLGGELAVDRRDPIGRPTAQRERMVLSAPWYGFGPDLDMSKHELIDHAPTQIRVSWIVTASENRSVGVDFGYLLLRTVRLGGRAQTLVVFNSVHLIDAGPFAGIDTDLVGSGISDTFVAHIERYRELFAP